MYHLHVRHPAFFLAVAALAGGCSSDEPADTSSAPACDPAVEPHGVDPTMGHSFPDVRLTDCDGNMVTFDALRCQNAVTLLSIGAGWCQPCQAETPELETAAVSLADEGGGIVQVMFQDAAANGATTLFCRTWVEQFSLTFPVFVDPVGEALEPFGVSDLQTAMPLNVIVDRTGKALFVQQGKLENIEATMRMYLP